MAIDKTIIDTAVTKVEKAKKNVDDSSSYLDKLRDLSKLYDGISNLSFKTYVFSIDNEKYDIQELVTNQEFKDIFLNIIEKKYNSIVVNLKAILDKNGNGNAVSNSVSK